MDDTGSIVCPYCGQRLEVELDATISSQTFTTDCDVCCRAIEVTAQCEAGQILSLVVEAA